MSPHERTAAITVARELGGAGQRMGSVEAPGFCGDVSLSTDEIFAGVCVTIRCSGVQWCRLAEENMTRALQLKWARGGGSRTICLWHPPQHRPRQESCTLRRGLLQRSSAEEFFGWQHGA